MTTQEARDALIALNPRLTFSAQEESWYVPDNAPEIPVKRTEYHVSVQGEGVPCEIFYGKSFEEAIALCSYHVEAIANATH